MAASVVGTTVSYKTNAPEGVLPAVVLRQYALKAVTGIAADIYSNTFTKTSHGYFDGNIVQASSLGAMTGISGSTNYVVVNALPNTFQLATIVSGTTATPDAILELATASAGNVTLTGVATNLSQVTQTGVLTPDDATALASNTICDLLVLGVQPVKLSLVAGHGSNIDQSSAVSLASLTTGVTAGKWFKTA